MYDCKYVRWNNTLGPNYKECVSHCNEDNKGPIYYYLAYDGSYEYKMCTENSTENAETYGQYFLYDKENDEYQYTKECNTLPAAPNRTCVVC